ncbi:uncharacterized protein LOC126901568 [Daktulosphaira vitifoliae]|uniref:uncharacterized protein LOC126901568 n=1 Tax=Daktulosphaira vitifoliae TaxID=58002 RepID=UPI0021AA7D5E|nr:uncharacterized protein LOC126901568 [Daktulosphaira vitifoliae]
MFSTQLNEKKLYEMFTKYALNGNNMGINELNNLLDANIGDMTRDDYTKIFQAFDSNNDGQISVEDLHTIINKIDPNYMNNTKPSLDKYYKDKNRLISLEEFVQVMNDLKK